MVNIALVRDATVETSELTVVMGANNSGKSTVATVLYAALKAASNNLQRIPYGGASLWQAPVRGPGRLLERVTEALTEASSFAGATSPEQLLRSAARRSAPALLEAYGMSLVAEVERGLGATFDELATRDTATGRRLPSKIVIECNAWILTIRITARGPNVTTEVRDIPQLDLESLPLSASYLNRVLADRSDLRFLTDMLYPAIAAAVFREFPSGAHYLPAARAGLLQSHRLVAAAMLQRSAYVGLQELSMPSLSGVVADFVSEILVNSPSRRPPFHRIAQQIEDSVLGGTVQQVVKESGYPEIEYTDEYGSHPVHRTSSMVSELAPVVLLLRSSIRVGDLLIIEEPESHLHPAAQVEFAAALYDLAQRGVRVFVTTHSDYFLSALSNRSREDAVRRRRKRLYPQAFWMARTTTGSHLEHLPSDEYDGISDLSFVEVAERLYDERVEQQLALSTGETPASTDENDFADVADA